MTQAIARKCAILCTNAESQGRDKKTESAFCGEQDRVDLPRMATQSLPQSKDLITPNKKQATESLDSAASCVGTIERKTQRVGIRLTLTQRRALEMAAQQKRLSLSDYILSSSLISKNIAA